ncbi:hypothetical protein R3P38DRAFT_3271258 [Favolaschia claudopus]|uniref:Uncharacterized protein n=1 Tax=Favolaschia claudopus TaxID=2862362 RepID=A0AAW0B9D2_9AGAR
MVGLCDGDEEKAAPPTLGEDIMGRPPRLFCKSLMPIVLALGPHRQLVGGSAYDPVHPRDKAGGTNDYIGTGNWLTSGDHLNNLLLLLLPQFYDIYVNLVASTLRLDPMLAHTDALYPSFIRLSSTPTPTVHIAAARYRELLLTLCVLTLSSASPAHASPPHPFSRRAVPISSPRSSLFVIRPWAKSPTFRMGYVAPQWLTQRHSLRVLASSCPPHLVSPLIHPRCRFARLPPPLLLPRPAPPASAPAPALPKPARIPALSTDRTLHRFRPTSRRPTSLHRR